MFWQAMGIGLAIAAPVGPIGLLCISRTLRGGPRLGLATGLGAASADGLYALAGVCGGSALLAFAGVLAKPLAWAGCLLLAWLGWSALRGAAAGDAPADGENRLGRAYLGTLALTLSNPMTIASFAAVAAGLSGGAPLAAAGQAQVVLGVFCGSALWWLLLAYGGGALLSRLGAGGRRGVNAACGALLLALAAALAWKAAVG
ncbi:LysE family transporter [Chromobacterium phragmitis]|uniref:LysE family transporter n=1 Tax=Chromobacterium phragmitis TaxID=2202141 RepID=A0ABV0IR89_9NEIS